jgi:hypothetical protein
VTRLPVHPFQQAFLDAFMAWDGYGMAGAFISIVEAVGNFTCSETTKTDLTWSCREFLESMGDHPGIFQTVEIPEQEFDFSLGGMVQWAENPPAQHPRVKLQISFHSESQALQDRWQELGFSSEEFLIERQLVKTPFPWNGEPGYSSDWQHLPNIHKPEVVEKIPTSHTYAYALSLEKAEGNLWLARYRKGECEEVWAEMLALGSKVRDVAILPYALAVVRETMRHCRENIERIILRLQDLNYPFKYPDEAFVPPDPTILERIAAMESMVGALPLSLCAWYEIVGSVNLIADEESEGYPDPLYVESSHYILEYNDESWQRERYILDISPDEYHKEDVSGGAPYQIQLPNTDVDALLENECHQTSFVHYLRLSFKSCGFPGIVWEEAEWQASRLKTELLPI